MKNKYTNQELAHIWLDSFLGLEYKHKSQLVECVDIDKQGFNLGAHREYLIAVVGANVYNTLCSSANQVYLNYVLQSLNKRGVDVLAQCSQEYPENLLNIPCPPFVIYAKGNLSLIGEQNIFAIVGSRKSLPLSVKLAQSYAKEMIDANFTLITGTANGIDESVLVSSINNNGKIISVVAGGFDHVYPSTNQDLVNRVAENGLIISEYPPETISKPFHFPVRNRIISALSRGVLVVSGARKSGTIYTAEYAMEYGKDLFAIPYSVGVQSGEGCNDLIKQGAILTDTPKDVLDFYGIDKQSKKISVTDEQKQVLKALSNGEQHIEKLSTLLKKPTYQITPVLAVLEIKGLITKSGNIYGLTGNYLED